jgi:hypothetical protein
MEGRMAKPENEFPTIRDLRDRLSELVDRGLGDHPVQVVVVPDSTMQAIARDAGFVDDRGRPVLMAELAGPNDGTRIPVTILSTDRWTGHEMPTANSQ